MQSKALVAHTLTKKKMWERKKEKTRNMIAAVKSIKITHPKKME